MEVEDRPANDRIHGWGDGHIPHSFAGHEGAKLPAMAALPLDTPEMTESPLSTTAAPGAAATVSSSNGSTQSSYSGSKGEIYTETTTVELVSTSATSSAFPESFGLSISIKGRWIAAYSSSALYVLSVEHLPDLQGACRGFRIRRKPLAVSITDVGKLAVLTTSHKIDIYQCGDEPGDLLSGPCKKLETVYLNNEARTLAFSYCGEVVAAGSDTGIEIRNLGPGSLETDKRQINCASVEYLAFSEDGRSILATASARRARVSTFISVNEAFEDALLEENPIQQPLGKVWITQLLFPERMSVKQAVLLPESKNEPVNELLAFDSHSDRYRVFDISLKRFSKQQLDLPEGVRWSRTDRFEDALPAVSSDGAYAAMAVRQKGNKELWVYKIPPNWREEQENSDLGAGDGGNSLDLQPFKRLIAPSKEDGAPPENITCLRWLQPREACDKRLVALVSTVTLTMPEDIVPTVAPAASGRLLIFDFKNSLPESEGREPPKIVLDLDQILLTEGLADEILELDREVDIVRRRTQVQRQRPDLSTIPSPRESRTPRRSLSSGSTNGGAVTLRDLADANGSRSARRRRSFSSMSSMSEDTDVGPIDEPYSQQQPRSQFSLHRAATMAANSAAARTHLRALPTRPLEYRRADGLREMPHESDADNWVPPPPPYSAEPDNAVSLPISANPQLAAAYLPRNQAQRSQRNRPMQPSHPPSAPMAAYPPPAQVVLRPATSATPSPPPGQDLPVTALRTRAQTTSAPPPAPTQPTQIIPRRPVGSREPSGSSPLAPPMPGYLSSPMTFPQTQRSPRGGSTDLRMPRTEQLATIHSQSTPVSPVTRVDASGRTSPMPTIPTAEQITSLHRRSGSGESVPRAAVGAHVPRTLRRVSSIERMRPLPPLPPDDRALGRQSTESGHQSRSSPVGRENQRPTLNRLATITSVASHPQNPNDPMLGETLRSAHTTPDTPTSRRQWWRIGPPKDIPQRPGTAPLPSRPGTAAANRPREKEGNFKCNVM